MRPDGSETPANIGDAGSPGHFVCGDGITDRDPHLVLRDTFHMTGILTTPPQQGGAIVLLCEMEICYCPRGRACFIPAVGPWQPTEEHVRRRAFHGNRTPGNIRLAHRLCNLLGVGWSRGHYKQRLKAALKAAQWHLDNPEESARTAMQRAVAEATWRTIDCLRQKPSPCPNCRFKRPFPIRYTPPESGSDPQWCCPKCGGQW